MCVPCVCVCACVCACVLCLCVLACALYTYRLHVHVRMFNCIQMPSPNIRSPTSEEQENVPLPNGPIVPAVVANEVKKVVQKRKGKGIVCMHSRLYMYRIMFVYLSVWMCACVYMYVCI